MRTALPTVSATAPPPSTAECEHHQCSGRSPVSVTGDLLLCIALHYEGLLTAPVSASVTRPGGTSGGRGAPSVTSTGSLPPVSRSRLRAPRPHSANSPGAVARCCAALGSNVRKGLSATAVTALQQILANRPGVQTQRGRALKVAPKSSVSGAVQAFAAPSGTGRLLGANRKAGLDRWTSAERDAVVRLSSAGCVLPWRPAPLQADVQCRSLWLTWCFLGRCTLT